MPGTGDVRQTLKLSADGAATVAVRDRHQATGPGDIVDVHAVVGTAPAGSALTFQVRVEGVVAATGSIPAGQTEVDVAVAAPVAFTEGQTIDLNITAVGSGTAGSDLDVTVEYVNR